MTKPITNFDDLVEIYFESGSACLRFKEGGLDVRSVRKNGWGNRSFLDLAKVAGLAWASPKGVSLGFHPPSQ